MDENLNQAKAIKLHMNISNFKQGSEESLGDALVRFNELIFKYPNNKFDELTLMQNFYNGVKQDIRDPFDTTPRGGLM